MSHAAVEEPREKDETQRQHDAVQGDALANRMDAEKRAGDGKAGLALKAKELQATRPQGVPTDKLAEEVRAAEWARAEEATQSAAKERDFTGAVFRIALGLCIAAFIYVSACLVLVLAKKRPPPRLRMRPKAG
ncbi:MAG: hypothetical protein HY291_19885 [Planctomycetes bacterium]|nr:hypothetical protein [Planctomycetota bacterium]